MFKSVLVAEDQQGMNRYVQQELVDLKFTQIKYVYYCDDALLRLKHGDDEGHPFELLITDLSFVDDGRAQIIKNGADLIKAARERQPDLKILVFSAEMNEAVISGLFQQLGIDAYVLKGRTDIEELKDALVAIHADKHYISPQLRRVPRRKNGYNFTKIDLLIVSQLWEGTKQNQIPAYLELQGAKATSLSSVEKRLNLMREALGFTNNGQLISYCKERKLI